MKILFHSNHIKKDSPHFYYSFNYPPKGIEYIEADKSADVQIDPKQLPAINAIVGIIKIILACTGSSIPNVSTPAQDRKYDLVHSFNTIPKTDKPFIVEMEAFHSLYLGGALKGKYAEETIKNYLKKDNCKKILFWTQNAYDNFNKMMNDQVIKGKSEILYPAVPVQKQIPFRKKPTLGFIGRNFQNKGGPLALRVMLEYIKAGKAKGLLVTNEKIQNDSKLDIKTTELIPRAELNKKVFPNIDILLYPGYSDSFGFIFPEAASFGIPILTTDGCARRELVHSGKGGFVAHRVLSDFGYPTTQENEEDMFALDLNMGLTSLITDNKLRKSMSDYNYNLVKNGMFSFKKRNKRLAEIYKEALK